MNAVAEIKPSGVVSIMTNTGRMAVADIISHVATVQEVMRAVMKKDVHFGIIPGTDKPTLYKPGAEVLCMAFRIADGYAVEDLSTDGMVRYRVTCTGTHQTTGVVLGAGMGEASSGEEKYKWRKAFDPEFAATPDNMRRVKHGKYTTQQVRTEPADLANTILKMANKRAKMAMVLNVTAASDCFSQDLEDMDEAMRDHLTRQDAAPAATTTQPTWPDDTFAKRLPKWKQALIDGKTIDGVVSFALTIGALTDDQLAQIKALPAQIIKEAGQRQPEGRTGPAASYAQIADAMTKAADMDSLNDAASLITAIDDKAQSAELNAIYDQRAAALN